MRAIVRALVKKAKTGNIPAAREVLDRLIGKPPAAEDDAKRRRHTLCAVCGPPE